MDLYYVHIYFVMFTQVPGTQVPGMFYVWYSSTRTTGGTHGGTYEYNKQLRQRVPGT